MASVNKVILIGNLGRDPEVKYTQGGQAVGTLNLATTDRWNNKQTGKPEERTEWHRVVVWGKLAELCKEYLAKGRSVFVEGRLQTRSWDDKETGQKKYSTEIVANAIQFLDKRGAGGEGGFSADGGSGAGSSGSGSSSSAAPSGPDSGPPPFSDDDDIPF